MNERDLDVRCIRMKPYALGERVLVDVQQILPLPEASEYVVRVREKERRERQARASSRDYTRYDVTIAGRTFERQSKRRMVHLLVKELCAQGIPPTEIAERIPSNGNRLWRCAPGELDAEAFAARMELDARAGGPAWDPRRWHCEDGDLVHGEGQTWALSNQWGGKTREAVEALLAKWPDAGIAVRESAG